MSGKMVHTAATQFLTKSHLFDESYTRNSPLGVPGDYLYFESKDDYRDIVKAGDWRGDLSPVPSDSEIRSVLESLGFSPSARQTYENTDTSLRHFLSAIVVQQHRMYQASESGHGTADLSANFGGWQFFVRPVDPQVRWLELDSRVDIVTTLRPPE